MRTIYIGEIYMLALLIPYLAVSVRRLHDTGRSAWWLLLFPNAMLVSVVFVVVLFLVLLPVAFGSDIEGGDLIGALIMLIVGFALFVGCSILPLILCARPGTVGPNRYGPDPLNPAPDVGGSGGSP